MPGSYTNLNKGLQTLQFQSLSVNPQDPKNIQGGTQDNGTFETMGSSVVWPQTIFGDGGLSGFDTTDKSFRFHTYTGQQVDVNFQNGAPPAWDWIADPLFAEGGALFYFPIISDPAVHGTMYAGLHHVWRTQDDGGPKAYLDQHCNEFTGDFTVTCGDWVPLDGTSLTSASRGTRSGGAISWVSRTTADSSTLWAATTTGRVFISKNADANPASSVTFTRCDSLRPNSPGRAVSSISIDPTNPNHAYISYLSYSVDHAGQLRPRVLRDVQPGRRHGDLGGPRGNGNPDRRPAGQWRRLRQRCRRPVCVDRLRRDHARRRERG